MNSFKKDEKAPSTQHSDIKLHKNKEDKMNNNDNHAQSVSESQVKSEHAQNAPKQEQKSDNVKLGSNVPSLVEKVGNSYKEEDVNDSSPHPEQSEKK